MRCGTRRRRGGAEDETYYPFKMRNMRGLRHQSLNNLSIKFYSHLSALLFFGEHLSLTLHSREHCNCNVSMNNDEKQRATRRIKEKYHKYGSSLK